MRACRKVPLTVGIAHKYAQGRPQRDYLVTPIPSDKKRTEKDFYRELEEARPKVLGALLDAVIEALGNLVRVELKEKPRMADFAVWVTAAEQALGWKSGAFMRAYSRDRSEIDETTLANYPVAEGLTSVRQSLRRVVRAT